MSQISGPEIQPTILPERPLIARIGNRILESYTQFKDGDDVGSIQFHVGGINDSPYEWQGLANCKNEDPNIFFPERGEDYRQARRVCGGCIVRLDCLEHALATREKHGMWGGATEQERRRILRNRRAAERRATKSAG